MNNLETSSFLVKYTALSLNGESKASSLRMNFFNNVLFQEQRVIDRYLVWEEGHKMK